MSPRVLLREVAVGLEVHGRILLQARHGSDMGRLDRHRLHLARLGQHRHGHGELANLVVELADQLLQVHKLVHAGRYLVLGHPDGGHVPGDGVLLVLDVVEPLRDLVQVVLDVAAWHRSGAFA